MKEEILKLRALGYSYGHIQKELNCSKGTISYHLGEGQKLKTCNRRKKSSLLNPLGKKISSFTEKKNFDNKLTMFNRSYGDQLKGKIFVEEVRNKIGINPICYLSGRSIDILDSSSYQLDHIIPRSKGGENTLENLGISCKDANQSKRDMLLKDYLNLCKEVLEFNGYKVEKL